MKLQKLEREWDASSAEGERVGQLLAEGGALCCVTERSDTAYLQPVEYQKLKSSGGKCQQSGFLSMDWLAMFGSNSGHTLRVKLDFMPSRQLT